MKNRLKNVKLNFSTKSHDEKIVEADKRDEQRKRDPRQKQIKKRAHDIFQRWKKRLMSGPRKPKEITAATYKLQTDIGALAKEAEACGLKEWHDFTMGIIEDRIATCISTSIVSKNEITMWVPEQVSMLDAANNKIVRDQMVRDTKPVTFRTLDELKAIPFVASFMSKQRFVGFVLHGKGLVAVFGDGEAVPVGILANGCGVDTLPTLDAFVESLAATPTPDAGLPPGATGSDTGASTPS